MSALGVIGVVIGGFAGVTLFGAVEKRLFSPNTMAQGIIGFPFLLLRLGVCFVGGVAIGYIAGDTLEKAMR